MPDHDLSFNLLTAISHEFELIFLTFPLLKVRRLLSRLIKELVVAKQELSCHNIQKIALAQLVVYSHRLMLMLELLLVN